MGISIGGKNRSRNSVLTPSNVGMGDIAQRRLNQVVGQHNRRQNESFKVDGIPVLIWNRQRAGRPCSCSTTAASDVNDTTVTDIMRTDADTKIVQRDSSDIIKKPSNHFAPKHEADSFHDPKDFPATGLVLRGRDPETYHNNTTDNLFGNTVASKSTGFRGNADLCDEDGDGILDTDDDEWEFSEELEDDNEIPIDDVDIFNTLFGGDKTPCAVCMGTKFTEGYQLVSGRRVVLDITASPDLVGFSPDYNSYPNNMNAPDDTSLYIDWKVDLPKYFIKVVSLHVHNNLETVTNQFSLFTVIDGLEVAVDNDYLNSPSIRNGAGVTNIRLRPKGLTPNDDVTFTHVEIVYQLAPWPYAQMPPISEDSSDLSQGFDVLVSAFIELGGDVPNISKEAVIEDLKHRRVWKVENSIKKETTLNQIFGYDLDVRGINPTSTLYRLKQSSNQVILPKNFTSLSETQQLPRNKEQKV